MRDNGLEAEHEKKHVGSHALNLWASAQEYASRNHASVLRPMPAVMLVIATATFANPSKPKALSGV